MNLVDILILAILGGFVLKGLLRGLLKELCSLVGLLLGTFLAFRFHAPLAETLVEMFRLPAQLCVIASFLALFLATLMFFAVLGYLLSRFVKLIFLGGFNRVAGGGFGLVQGGVLLALILFALSLGPRPGFIDRAFQSSELAPPFVELGKSLFDASASAFAGRS